MEAIIHEANGGTATLRRADAQALCFCGAEHRDAVARFLDKRPAAFSGPTGELT